MNSLARRYFLLRLTAAVTMSCSPLFAQITVPRATSTTPQPDALITLVKSVQRKHVRESIGTNADQCFTDVDLATFRRNKTVEQIVKEVSGSRRMTAIVSELKSMPVVQQEEILDKANSTFKPTWAQLGKIDRAGQTEAGQIAEREIAEAIVRIARAAIK